VNNVKPREAVRHSYVALISAAMAAGGACDPNADSVIYEVIEVLKKVREGASQADVDTEVTRLESFLKDLERCLYG
jgi:hypothetical protein